jgi:hypothetical protein
METHQVEVHHLLSQLKHPACQITVRHQISGQFEGYHWQATHVSSMNVKANHKLKVVCVLAIQGQKKVQQYVTDFYQQLKTRGLILDQHTSTKSQ